VFVKVAIPKLSHRQIKVLVVDDHTVVSLALEAILNAEGDIRVVATADRGETAIQKFRQLRPNIVLMDLYMPGMSGISALEAIIAEFPPARIIVLSAYDRVGDIFHCMRSGVSGYIVKDAPVESIVQAVRLVDSGGTYFPAAITDKTKERSDIPELTDRELLVLRLMTECRNNVEIASRMNLGLGTVKFHIQNIFAKLGAHDRTHAVTKAISAGIIDL
jgi:two-component system NarL family response regulator